MLSGSIKKAMKHPMGTVKVMLAWGHLATHRPNCLCVGEVLCLREMEREREWWGDSMKNWGNAGGARALYLSRINELKLTQLYWGKGEKNEGRKGGGGRQPALPALLGAIGHWRMQAHQIFISRCCTPSSSKGSALKTLTELQPGRWQRTEGSSGEKGRGREGGGEGREESWDRERSR